MSIPHAIKHTWGNQFLIWLMANEGEGLRKDFVRYSSIKQGSMDELQKILEEKGLMKTEDRDGERIYRLTSKGLDYCRVLKAEFVARFGK
jgi:DNA-binding PadR family transcriptional regulator